MDSVALSRRNQTSKKGNKENTQPAHGSKSFVKRDKTYAAPFQLKGNKKEEILSTSDALKTKVKPVSSVAVKKGTAVQRDGKGGSATDIQRQTHSRAFVAEQAAKLKKISAEAPKPPAAVAPVKAAPGLYKGRIIQSKIGSIWKSSSNLSAPDPKATAAGTESRPVGNVTKSRSKSVSEVPARGTRQPAVLRSKSAFDKRTQVTKPTASSRPPAAFSSARPTASSRPPAAFSSARPTASSRPPAAFSSARPPTKTIPATKPKVNKPAASSSLSQYRLTMETAEERRVKLAEWLASKGKSLKRPAMAVSAAPAKNKTAAKPGDHPKVQSESVDEAHRGCEPELSLETQSAAHCADTQEAELPAPSRSPLLMETSLQLLEDSELDPHEGVEDVVVNLCHALEAMETPSACRDDCTQVKDESNGAELESDKPEDERSENVTDEEDGSDDDDDVEEKETEGEDVGDSSPQAEDASVIKYSIKTTPYLQHVRKTLVDEAGASSSRKRINIGDLKLVTPVRRSSRIERKSSRLPAMLQDHDPTVSSLAELVQMNDDPNAFICRRNVALLEELPGEGL